MISLHPLDRDDAARVAHIAVRPDQQIFAGTVAQALSEPRDRFDLHEIRRADRAVGLFKIDRAYHRDYDFAAPGDLGLRAVMIDARAQGGGIGKSAMAALSAYLAPRYPDAATLWLTVNLSNPVAIAVYRAAGFIDDGAVWPHGRAGPQHILRLSLREGKTI